MSTPLVAGAASVTRQFLIGRFGILNPSAAVIKATLLHSASDLYPGQYGEGSSTQELQHRPENNQGFGRVNLESEMKLLGTAQILDQTTGVSQGETQDQWIYVAGGQTLSATLAYTDAPSTPSAAQNIVNVLELGITSPDGVQTLTKDEINNTKTIELSNLSQGNYKISVIGSKVPMGKNGRQPYALIIGVK